MKKFPWVVLFSWLAFIYLRTDIYARLRNKRSFIISRFQLLKMGEEQRKLWNQYGTSCLKVLLKFMLPTLAIQLLLQVLLLSRWPQITPVFVGLACAIFYGTGVALAHISMKWRQQNLDLTKKIGDKDNT